MNLTLQGLLAALSSDLGYDAIPSSTVTARLTRYLSEGYRHLMSMPELSPLRLNMITFTSAPGQTIYGVPQSLVQIHQMVDPTGSIRLRLMTLDQLRTIDPQETSSGTPTHYIPVGLHPVLRQPTHKNVYAIAELAADTTQVISLVAVQRIDEIDTRTGLFSATINGITPVLIVTDIVNIQNVTLSAPATGSIALYDTPTPTVPGPESAHRLASIQAGQLTVQYVGIRLWPTPSDARIYHVDGDLTLQDMLVSTDISLLPSDFEYILTDYARMREYEYRDDSRVSHAAARYEQKLKYLRNRLMNTPDFKPRVGRIEDRSTNIGDGYFPPGRW